MEEKLRNSGINIVGNISWGIHFCQFYQTKTDLMDIIIPYFKAGLEDNEFCVWVTSDFLGVEEAKEILRKSITNIDNYLDKGQIELIPFTDFYLEEGISDPDKILNCWIEKLNHSQANGYTGLRVMENNYWLGKESWKNYLDYEEKLNSFVNKHQIIVLCSYCVDICSPIDIIEISKNHQFVLAKKEEKWECLENSIQRNVTQRNQMEEQLIESKKLYQSIGELIPYGIWICGPDGGVIYLSDSFLDMVGMTLEECKQFGWTDRLPPEDLEQTIADWKHCIETSSFWDYEHHILGKDGEYHTVLSRGIPIRDDLGNTNLWVGINLDITARKQAEESLRQAHEEIQMQSEELKASNEEIQLQSEELQAQTEELEEAYEALRESEQQFRTVIENSRDGINMLDLATGLYVFMSPSQVEMTGFTAEEINNISAEEAYKRVHSEDRKISVAQQKRLAAGLDTTNTVEYRWKVKSGEYRWFSDSRKLVRDDQGRPIALVGVSRDITERKLAEKALRESESIRKVTEAVQAEREQLNRVLDMLPAYVILLSPDYHVPFANRFFEERFGKSEGQRCYEYLFQRTEPCENCETYKVLKTGKPHRWEWTGPDGRNYDIYDYPFKDSDGSTLIMEAGIDITEIKQAQSVVQAERQRLFDVLETLPAIICLLTPDYHFVFTNHSFHEKFGEPGNRPCYEHCFGCTRPCEFCEAYKVLETDQPHHWEFTCLDGSIIDAYDFPFTDVDGSPMILKMDIDITERRKAKEALAKIEEARIKEIHHRIKNNLQVISSLLDLEAERFSDIKVLNAFKESQNRVASMALIHEELYKGKGSDSLDFAAYLRKLTTNLLNSYNLKNNGISLKLDFGQSYLNMDTAIPLGIIVNELVSNSLKHAFPGRSGGVIQIKIARETSKECANAISRDNLEACRGISYTLTISDDGIGMPEGFDLENAETLGIQLVTLLVDQLDGKLGLIRDCGTKFTIQFIVPEKGKQA